MKDNDIPLGYTRVTEVLMPYKNFDNIPAHLLEIARNRGDETHEVCDLYALKLLIKKPSEEVKPYFESFKMWFDECVSETILTETRMIDEELLLAGKPDWVGILVNSNKIVLADWKTPQINDISWRLQTAAYRYLLRVTMGIEVDRRLVIRLCKDGKFPVVTEYLDHDLDERMFLNQLEIYRMFHPVIK